MRTRLILSLGVLLLMGCASEFTVQKRRYRPGWHIEKKGTHEEMHTASRKSSKPAALINKDSPVLVAQEKASSEEFLANESDLEEPTLAGMAEHNSNASETVEPVERSVPVKNQVSFGKMKGNTPNRSNQVLAGILCSGLLAGGLFTWKKRRFLKLSEWAKANRGRAQAILTSSHLVLGFGAFYAGFFSGSDSMMASEGWFTGSLWTFLAAWALYPMRNVLSGILSGGFLRRKWHDLLLTVSGILLVFSTATEIQSGKEPSNALSAAAISVLTPDFEENAETTFTAAEPQQRTPGEVLSLILLTVLAAAVFVYLMAIVGSISCSLSCSGQEGLATVVLIGGLAAGIFLFTIALRLIWSIKFVRPAAAVN